MPPPSAPKYASLARNCPATSLRNLTFSAVVETTSDASSSFLVSWASFVSFEEQEKMFPAYKICQFGEESPCTGESLILPRRYRSTLPTLRRRRSHRTLSFGLLRDILVLPGAPDGHQ